ncbi:DnaJ-domain-containing protein [Atractiella rhizophila]|nr:DnaJ-domain-containing protein [Atractiella rhizophila]
MVLEYSASEDYYALLQLPSTATAAQISSSFRKLSIKVHPDRFPDKAGEFIALKKASEVLLDPETRAKWFGEFESGREARERKRKLEGRRRVMVDELERVRRRRRRGRRRKSGYLRSLRPRTKRNIQSH